MKPILVHLHIYYIDMWEELKNCLKNIEPFEYELYVTMIAEHKDLQRKILEFNSATKIEIIENRGFDIGPFVHITNKVDLDKYSYVIKLHTKRNMDDTTGSLNGFSIDGDRWRNYLLYFIKNKEIFNKQLEYFEKHNKAGMLSSAVIVANQNLCSNVCKKTLKNILLEKNIQCSKFKFVAGTMFIARSHIFKQLQNLKLTLQDFELVSHLGDGQLAHVMERYLGVMVYSQGYEICSTQPSIIFNKPVLSILSVLFVIRQFVYLNKITKSGKRLIKICKIPVYSRKVKNDKF